MRIATTILFLAAGGSCVDAFTSGGGSCLAGRVQRQRPAAAAGGSPSAAAAARSVSSMARTSSTSLTGGDGTDNPKDRDDSSSSAFSPSSFRLRGRKKGGTFLGIRRESGYLRRSLERRSSVAPLMPDGGLSPCVIKVLGVGGGGSNAVSLRWRCEKRKMKFGYNDTVCVCTKTSRLGVEECVGNSPHV